MLQMREVTLDLTDVAPKMMEAAVAVTTGRLSLASPVDARERLIKDDPVAAGHFRFELARQFASALLTLDPRVLAVYIEQDVAEAEELAPKPPAVGDPLQVVVHVQHWTAALAATIDALNDALVETLDCCLGHRVNRLIEAVIVDNRESRFLRARANGYRPAPMLLASRAEAETDSWI